MSNYQHRMIEIRVRFDGLYYWGDGWASHEKAVKWRSFLADGKADGIFWHHFHEGKGISGTDYLVGVSGRVFLHPMDFHSYLPIIGESYRVGKDGRRIECFSATKELIETVKSLAEYCGGEAVVEYIRLQEFNDNGNCKTTDIAEADVLEEGD